MFLFSTLQCHKGTNMLNNNRKRDKKKSRKQSRMLKTTA